MKADLAEHILASIGQEMRADVRAFATALGRENSAECVLFYGSNLRTGSREGVLDFYVLLPGRQKDRIWPRISYREMRFGDTELRAKIATMSMEKFHSAASGQSLDTTIWTRFVQPGALAYRKDVEAELVATEALAQAAMTAARIAAAIGPPSGTARAFWEALFRQTYRAEFRVEKPGRERDILSNNAAHFDGMLTAAWDAQGLPYDKRGEHLTPLLSPRERSHLQSYWSVRRRFGKSLNIARLAKAAVTFDGAADYAAWKLQRHTGIALPVTPFRRAHPLLAMPGAALDFWRATRRRGDQR